MNRGRKRRWVLAWLGLLGMVLGAPALIHADYLVVLDNGKELRVKRYRSEGSRIRLWLQKGQIVVPEDTVRVIVSLDPTPKTRSKKPSGGKKPPQKAKAAEAPGQTPAVAEHTDLHGHGEAWWRERIGKVRTEIQAVEEDLGFVEKEIASLKADLGLPDGLKGAFYEEARDRLGYFRIRRAELKFALERLHRQLEEELPEEARKAGAWPGWLRE